MKNTPSFAGRPAQIAFLVLLAALTVPIFAAESSRTYPHRWVFVQGAPRDDADVQRISQIATTASEHGLNGLVLSAGLDTLTRRDSAFIDRIRRIKRACEDHNVEFIPQIFSAGYGGSVLTFDRNLAAAVRVEEALFEVSEGLARIVSDPAAKIENSDFEHYSNHRFTAYQFHDKPGEVSFVDTETSHTGKASIRFENFGRFEHGHARVMQEIPVKPHHCYRLSCHVKTDQLKPASGFQISVLTTDGRNLAPFQPSIPSTGDWRKIEMGFNSLDYDKARIYAGVWGGVSGRFWIDSFELEEVGLLNVLRRPGTPITVKNASTGDIYTENRDYAPISDPHLTFRFDHACPAITILPDSRIKDGDRLAVSYYHGMSIHRSQVPICMSEPKLYEIWTEQARALQRYFAPRKVLLSMDEIRVGGACKACRDRNMSMAQILGDCITKQVAVLRDCNPDMEVFIWSDMLDPNHNAHDNYYLVDGDFTGSWNYIPKDLTIVCWHHKIRDKSLSFFSEHGFKTLAGAYYDADTLDNPEQWLESLDKTPHATGIMYTTWQNKYDLLPAFGDLVSKPK